MFPAKYKNAIFNKTMSGAHPQSNTQRPLTQTRAPTDGQANTGLYDRDELASWVPRVLEVAEQSDETHIVFNNCYANYGTTNALEMSAMLAEAAADQ